MLRILKCWPADGGRFVTLPMVNTVDPQTGVRNVGMYRMQVFDDHTTGMHWHIHKTGARHYDAWKRSGRRMPVSVALGGDPAYTYAATAPMPDNMDEYLLAGFLRRRPVKLVKCVTNDIYVHVTSLTLRRDAVYPATVVGIPPQEDACIAQATERIFLAPIRMALQPEIRDMTMPEAGTAHNIAVVSIDSRYAGQAVKVAQSLWGAGQMMFNKYMLVVPAATDVRDSDALARLVRNLDPLRNIVRSEGILDVLDHATATPGFGGKIALDATACGTGGGCANPQEPATRVPADPPRGVEGVRPAADGAISGACAGQGDGGQPLLPAGYRSDLLEKWGVAVAFAAPDAEVPVPPGVKYLAVFDPAAEELTAAELLWLAAANTDPRRDVRTEGAALVIDARSKRPGAGENPGRFPNVVTASEATVALVDRRWPEYGLGAFVGSPSRRYRRLLLSDGAQWR